MNWLKKSTRNMPVALALEVFGFPPSAKPSGDELKSRRRELSVKYHPDKPGGNAQRMVDVNNAWDVLKTVDFSRIRPGHTQHTHSREDYGPSIMAPWQTDARSSSDWVGTSRRDVHYCMKEIYEYSIKNGSVQKWTIWGGGSVFTVFTNPASFGFVGEVMEEWNSSHHPATDFVLATQDSRIVRVIRIDGVDVSSQNIELEHESFNYNPFNDKYFGRALQDLLRQYRSKRSTKGQKIDETA